MNEINRTCMKAFLLKFLVGGALFGGGAGGWCAPSYAIDWFTVDGGGGVSTGSVYAVSGTLGQPDAGPAMSGGNYSVTGGFWSVMAAVQMPGAPKLAIIPSGTNAVISWPSVAGFTLQTNVNLVNTNGWGDFTGAVSDNGTTKSVTVPARPGNNYFRLKP